MVKVLHVIGKMNRGGAETMLMNYYRNIDKNKVHFDFLVQTNDKCDYDDEILCMGGNIYRLPQYLVYNSYRYRRACQKFFGKYHDYDIVHGHIGSCASIYLSEAKKYGICAIAHSHSTDGVMGIRDIVFKMVSKNTRNVADFFFGCSLEAGENRYGMEVAHSNRFFVLPNAIDVKQYSYSLERHMGLKKKWKLEDKIVFGHVGRLSREKNHKLIIEVFLCVCQKEPRAYLVLVGEGPSRHEIERLIKQYRLEERVLLTGVRNDIPDMMNLFDLFLFPSSYEGLGIALIEAQASGLPCVTSDTIPNEAILTQNVRRISLQKSAEVWADEILLFIKSFKRKNEYDSICAANYNIAEEAKKLCDFYSNCLVKR